MQEWNWVVGTAACEKLCISCFMYCQVIPLLHMAHGWLMVNTISKLLVPSSMMRPRKAWITMETCFKWIAFGLDHGKGWVFVVKKASLIRWTYTGVLKLFAYHIHTYITSVIDSCHLHSICCTCWQMNMILGCRFMVRLYGHHLSTWMGDLSLTCACLFSRIVRLP